MSSAVVSSTSSSILLRRFIASSQAAAIANQRQRHMSSIASASLSSSLSSSLSNGFFTFSSHTFNQDREDVFMAIREDESIRNTMAYSMAMASHSQKFPSLTPPMDDRMKEQLRISRDQLLSQEHQQRQQQRQQQRRREQLQESQFMTAPSTLSSSASASSLASSSHNVVIDHSMSLPKTLRDALRPTSRAVVITETTKPFRIVNVNKAWEDLCEYSYLECHGKSLGELIQGPETNSMAITALMSQLLQGNVATTILTNYTKSGRKFQNRLSVGPLYDDEDSTKITQFVGILQEV